MKNISKQVYKLATLLVLLLFVNCQKEDITKEFQTEHQEQVATRNTVSSGDIPEVMEFLRSKSNDKLEFKFSTNKTYSASNDPHVNDIVITQAMEDQIVQVVKDGKSNYAFKTKEKYPDYFLNLIVVETIDGYYMYFAKYVPSLETNWDGHSLDTFEGTQYVYSETGKFREKYYFSNGTRGMIPCECPSGGGGEEGCDFETWYICNFRNSLHQFQLQCNCYNSPEGCSGFNPIQVLVCNGINPTSIQPNSINYTSSEECYCWIEEGPTGSSGGSTGGGNNNCPNAQPCANELEELNEFCECEFAINPITPINPSPNMAKDINICLGTNFDVNTLNANPTIDQLYNYMFDDFGNCIDENLDFAEVAAEALLDGGEFDEENEIIKDSTFVSNDKVNCTYQKISQNTNFKNLLDNFMDEDTPYNLIFQVEPDLDCQSDGDIDEGCTSSSLSSNNSITISIDQDYINSNQTPTLFIAETIIHETIHANLYLALYNHEQGNTANLPDIDDFSAIYEQYRLYKGWQHEFMAGEYTSLIAQILLETHPLLNDQTFIDSLADYDMSLNDFYTCIAYIGLNNTIGQNNFLSDPTNEANYNLSYYDAQTNSTKTPNCD
jgi:hypothetical protein